MSVYVTRTAEWSCYFINQKGTSLILSAMILHLGKLIELIFYELLNCVLYHYL